MAWSKPRGIIAAELLRHTRGLGNGHVDVAKLAEQLEIDLVGLSWPHNPIEGKYVRRSRHAFVLVNTVQPSTRQRFTIAHEIGHHCLTEGDQDVEFTDDWSAMQSKENSERQANLFASALLMDERGVRDAAQNRQWARNVASIVTIFEVSLEAAAIRLRELDLLDDGTVTEFLQNLKASPEYRTQFMAKYAIEGRDNQWRYRTHLPTWFLHRARQLNEQEILSDERTHELLDRPRPRVEA